MVEPVPWDPIREMAFSLPVCMFCTSIYSHYAFLHPKAHFPALPSASDTFCITVLVMEWSWIPFRTHPGNLSRNRTSIGVLTPSLDTMRVPFHMSNGEPAQLSCAASRILGRPKPPKFITKKSPSREAPKVILFLQNSATTHIQTKPLSLPLVCWDCFSPSHLSFFVEHESKPGLVIPTLRSPRPSVCSAPARLCCLLLAEDPQGAPSLAVPMTGTPRLEGPPVWWDFQQWRQSATVNLTNSTQE